MIKEASGTHVLEVSSYYDDHFSASASSYSAAVAVSSNVDFTVTTGSINSIFFRDSRREDSL